MEATEQVPEPAVIDSVRQALERHHPKGIGFEVLASGIREEDGWWYVPIRPSGWPPKMFEYYEALADAEGELQEGKGLKG